MPPLFDYIDMAYPDGTPNPSGLATMHGFAPLTYFAANGIKKVDAVDDADGTAESIGSIATAHTFAVGKCMKRLYGTENKGDIKEDEVGDQDSTNAKPVVTIMTPGVKADYIAQKKKMRGFRGLIFTTLADGQVMMYGSEMFPCSAKVSWASGNNEGYRGYTTTFTCYGDGVIYTPGLNFTPAVAQ